MLLRARRGMESETVQAGSIPSPDGPSGIA
jgi:hypothetical protein